MPTREEVAQKYRAINTQHRPYYEGTREFWASMTVAQIAGWADAAIQAVKLDRQWRAASPSVGVSCVFGSKGCPPWAFRRCEGVHDGESVQGHLERTEGETVNRAATPTGKTILSEKQGGLM